MGASPTTRKRGRSIPTTIWTPRDEGDWTLLKSYTIDGSAQHGALALDWGMSDTDTFSIFLEAGSERASVAAGTAWLDDFVLKFPKQESLGGYELWASAIPGQAQQGPEDDASGNGIPNLLHYMYGLDPLSTDVDVSLSIRISGDVTELIHGINEDASDYRFVYLQNPTLTDEWSSDLVPDSATTFESNGRMFRRVALQTVEENTFFQLEIEPTP